MKELYSTMYTYTHRSIGLKQFTDISVLPFFGFHIGYCSKNYLPHNISRGQGNEQTTLLKMMITV